MERCGVDDLPRRRLHDLAQVHDRHAVRDLPHDGEVVRHEEIGDPELTLEVSQQVQDLGLDRDVERRNGLVTDDQLRPERDRPRDPNPLPLASGELVRVPVVVLRVEAHTLHELHDRVPNPALGLHPLHLERRADDAAHSVARVQGVVWVLEDHLRLAANAYQLLRRETRDLLALDLDLALRRTHQHQDGPRGRRLPRTAFTHESQGLPRVEGEVDAVDGLHLPDGSGNDSPRLHREVGAKP